MLLWQGDPDNDLLAVAVLHYTLRLLLCLGLLELLWLRLQEACQI